MRTLVVSLLLAGSLLAMPLVHGVELADEQVLHKGNGAEPQTLDPHKAEGVSSSNIMRDLFEGLTSETPDGEVIPGAAESWDISDDGRQYVFQIRKEARWSNGDPVTAHDFVYGLRRCVDPLTASKYSQILAPIKNAEAVVAGELPADQLGVRALDDHTLEVTLESATPYFLGLLNHASTYPVHKPSVERHGVGFTRPGNLVSNGAYVLKDWTVQSHITLVRNPEYWGNDDTTIDSVIYHATEDLSSELKRFRAGELDWTYEVPGSQVEWIKKNMPEALKVSTYLGIYYFGFNTTKPPFKDNQPLIR